MSERRTQQHPQCHKCKSLDTYYTTVDGVFSVCCFVCDGHYPAQRKTDAEIAEKRRVADIQGCGG